MNFKILIMNRHLSSQSKLQIQNLSTKCNYILII